MIAENKKIIVEDDERKSADLDQEMSELEKEQAETGEKMKQYIAKIKDGLWTDDQELRRQLKTLQDEAEGIERELKNKERSKGALKTQERLHKD